MVHPRLCKHQKSINISYGQGVEAGIGGQSLYHVGCIFVFKIEKSKKSFYFKNKIQIQIQNTDTDTDTKNKVKNKVKNINNKQQTTNIYYKL